MKTKLVSENLYEFKYENINEDIEHLDEGVKDNIAKALAVVAFSVALNLAPKQVKSMDKSELKSKVENVIDKNSKTINKTLTASGLNKQEAFNKLIQKVKDLEKEGYIIIKVGEVQAEKKENSSYFITGVNVLVKEKKDDVNKDEKTSENDKKTYTVKKSGDENITKKKINYILNQLRTKDFKYSVDKDNSGNAVISYWK